MFDQEIEGMKTTTAGINLKFYNTSNASFIDENFIKPGIVRCLQNQEEKNINSEYKQFCSQSEA